VGEKGGTCLEIPKNLSKEGTGRIEKDHRMQVRLQGRTEEKRDHSADTVNVTRKG